MKIKKAADLVVGKQYLCGCTVAWEEWDIMEWDGSGFYIEGGLYSSYGEAGSFDTFEVVYELSELGHNETAGV